MLSQAEIDEKNRVVGENLRRYRLMKGLKQEEVCEGLFSVSQLSKIENGKAQLKSSQLKQIAERLGVTVMQLQANDSFKDELKDKHQLAVHAYNAYNTEMALELTEEVLDHCRRCGYEDLYLESFQFQCRLLNLSSQYEAVIEKIERAFAEGPPMSVDQQINLLVDLGRAHAANGDMTSAIETYRLADEQFVQVEGETEGNLRLLYRLGLCHRLMRNYRASLRYAGMARDLAVRLSKHHWRILTSTLEANCLCLLKNYDTAYPIFTELLQEAQGNGMVSNVGILNNNLGCFYLEQGDLPQAQVHFQRSEQMFDLVKEDDYLCEPLLNLAEVYRRTGQYTLCHSYAGRVIDISTRLSGVAHYMFRARAQRTLAKMRADQGDWEQAIRGLNEVLALYDDNRVVIEAYEVAVELGEWLYQLNDPRATAIYSKAIDYNERCRALGLKK